MSNFSDGDRLSKELHERAHDIGGHPIGIDAVQRSARRIARRRRLASGAVAAAVLAVAVPIALAVTNGPDRSSEPVTPPRPTVTEPAVPWPEGPVRLTTKGLERGADPRVSYIREQKPQLVTADDTIEMPANYDSIVPFGGGWLAVGAGAGGPCCEIVTLDADEQVLTTAPGGLSLVMSTDGSRVGYVEVDPDSGRDTLVVAPTDGSDVTTRAMPPAREVSLVGFLDPTRIVYQLIEEQVVGVAGPDGELTELEGFLRVTSASEANGLVAGMVSYSGDGACWGVMDPAASTAGLVWRTCEYSLGAFSPDGRFVVAGDAYGDALGEPMLVILDAATGDPLVQFTQGPDGRVSLIDVVWEDDEHVLATALGGGGWTMLRAGLDGGLEQALDPVSGTGLNSPFWFASGP